ncbi:hypothetical protein BAP_2665 [Bacillus sp. CN2]|nr:hypothetical protein BAP_2665 [Bacillus sp. CN2]
MKIRNAAKNKKLSRIGSDFFFSLFTAIFFLFLLMTSPFLIYRKK